MKKIILGKGLEEVNGLCNFCGEENKECVKADVPETLSACVLDKSKFGWKWVNQGLFNVGDLVYAQMDENSGVFKVEEHKKHSRICKDCIEQLAKLIK